MCTSRYRKLSCAGSGTSPERRTKDGKRFLLLSIWQDIATILEALGLYPIPEKMIVIFYVDDVVIAYADDEENGQLQFQLIGKDSALSWPSGGPRYMLHLSHAYWNHRRPLMCRLPIVLLPFAIPCFGPLSHIKGFTCTFTVSTLLTTWPYLAHFIA